VSELLILKLKDLKHPHKQKKLKNKEKKTTQNYKKLDKKTKLKKFLKL
jgi:hypothetical protein